MHKKSRRIFALVFVMLFLLGNAGINTFAEEGHEHIHGDVSRENVINPGCMEDGSHDEVFYCSICGEEMSRTTVQDPAPGYHTPGEMVYEAIIPATCTAPGSHDEVVYCTACGAELSRETIPDSVTDHSPGEMMRENESAATCTAPGSHDEVVYCTICGAELSRTVVSEPIADHTPGDPVQENVTAPTCTEQGHHDEVVFCMSCGVELSRVTVTDEAPLAEHSWDEGTVTAEPTESAEGIKTYTCQVCGATRTEPVTNSDAGVYTDVIDENYEVYLSSPVEITIGVNDKKGGTVAPAGTFTPSFGSTFTCTAYPNDGYVFENWVAPDNIAVSPLTTYEFIADESKRLWAYFYEIILQNNQIDPQEYSGNDIEPDVGTVQLDGIDGSYVEGKDYFISYQNNRNVGKAAVTVTFFKGDDGSGFSGSKSIAFEILPVSIEKYVEVTVADQQYNGENLKPVPTVTWKGNELQEGRDFTLSYEDNVNAGTASVTVTGKGNFTDSISKTFRITRRPATIKVNSAAKGAGEKDPAFTGTVEGLVNSNDLGEIRYIRTNKDETAGTYEGVLTAEYTPNDNYEVTVENGDFTVRKVLTLKWLDGDGSVLQSKTYLEGDQPPVYDGKTPVKDADDQYHYTFDRWDAGTAEGTVTTYRPLFTETANKCRITFVDDDGTTVLKEAAEYAYGTAADQIVLPANPTKAATAQYTYTFSGWDPKLAEVTGDVTYKASYTAALNQYVVRFVNEDGTELQNTRLDYGSNPVYNAAAPTKAEDEDYTYTWSGWVDETGNNSYSDILPEVTKDVTYTATFTSNKKIKYTVTNGAGQEYAQGSDGTLTFVFKRSENDEDTFKHFSGAKCDGNTLTRDKDYTASKGSVIVVLRNSFLKSLKAGDHTLTAMFDDGNSADASFRVMKATTYKVTFHNNGIGTAPAAQTVAEGKKAEKPADPAAQGYTFGGWYTDQECTQEFDFNTPITADITLYAKWTKSGSGETSAASGSGGSFTSPRTGDTNNPGLWITLMVLSALAISGAVIALRRRRA